MNLRAVRAIYLYELEKCWQSPASILLTPIITTALYCIVVGSAFGKQLVEVQGIQYIAFIVPGLMMLSLMTESISGGSFTIFFRKYSGTIYEILIAPITSFEIVVSFVLVTATKALAIAGCIYLTASLFVTLEIAHPVWTLLYLIFSAVCFSLLGFIIGVMAKGFDRLQIIPTVVITPLAFLGGSFYSLDQLPEMWQKITLLNPVLYVVCGLRWCFYNVSDVIPVLSLVALSSLFLLLILITAWIFHRGHGLRI